MIGILLCSHSNFAQGLKDACQMIAGPQEKFDAIGFDGQEDLMEYSEKVKNISKDYKDGCIYVCDLVNGTPFNGCLLSLANTDNIILAGGSVPMVLELLIKRNNHELSCEQLALEIVESSHDYIAMRHSRDVFGE